MIDDLLTNMLNALGEGPITSFSDLVQTPGQYNSTLYSAALTLHDTAVKPITAVVLSIMVVLMLASNSTKIDTDRDLGVRIVAGTMVKAALVIIVTQQAVNILSALDLIASEIAASALAVGTSETGTAVAIGEEMRPLIEDAGIVDKLAMLVLIILPFLVTKLAGVLGVILIFARFIELYILTSFASLPLAFFAHEDTKGIGITYLKRYAGVALTGVILIVTVNLYQGLLGGWVGDNLSMSEGESIAGFVFSNFGSFFVAPLVLVFLLFGASRISKSIVGE